MTAQACFIRLGKLIYCAAELDRLFHHASNINEPRRRRRRTRGDARDAAQHVTSLVFEVPPWEDSKLDWNRALAAEQQQLRLRLGGQKVI